MRDLLELQRRRFILPALVFFALLGAGVWVAPLRLAAQSAAPAAVPSSQAASTQAASSQEEQDKVFLLEGPIVKWAAKTFNLSVERTAGIFEFANFLIIVLLVGIPIARIMPKIFRKRSQTLVESLRTARQATEDANARLSAVEAKLAGLDDEIKNFRAQVEQESLEDEARIKASLAEESARIVQAAEQELNVAAAQARRGLRHFAADLAIEQAAKQLDVTAATDRALIAEFIESVNGGARQGEQSAHQGEKN